MEWNRYELGKGTSRESGSRSGRYNNRGMYKENNQELRLGIEYRNGVRGKRGSADEDR